MKFFMECKSFSKTTNQKRYLWLRPRVSFTSSSQGCRRGSLTFFFKTFMLCLKRFLVGQKKISEGMWWSIWNLSSYSGPNLGDTIWTLYMSAALSQSSITKEICPKAFTSLSREKFSSPMRVALFTISGSLLGPISVICQLFLAIKVPTLLSKFITPNIPQVRWERRSSDALGHQTWEIPSYLWQVPRIQTCHDGKSTKAKKAVQDRKTHDFQLYRIKSSP